MLVSSQEKGSRESGGCELSNDNEALEVCSGIGSGSMPRFNISLIIVGSSKALPKL